MGWPQATDYNSAIQNPSVCFRDEDLRKGEVAGDMFGLPRPHAGNFADVYKVTCPDGTSWAVKCFTREVTTLHDRYEGISRHLENAHRSFMVEFDYQDEGIRIRGEWFPILKMRWVEGFTLEAFVQDQLEKRGIFDRLSLMWTRLSQELEDAEIGHGDLQHGNVLLVPKGANLALRLIDYDGMFVPPLADKPSPEKGHSNYQHPQRLAEGAYSIDIDRFSHLLIYTSFRALRVAGKKLWERYHNGDNLLFKEDDFLEPAKSDVLRILWRLNNFEVKALVGHLVLASKKPIDEVARLSEYLEGGLVRPLDADEEKQTQSLLGLSRSARKSQLGSKANVELPPLPVAIDTQGASAPPEATPVNPDDVPTTPIPDAIPAAEERALPSWIVPDAVPVQPTNSEEPKTPPPPLPTGDRPTTKVTIVSGDDVPAVPRVEVVPMPVPVEPVVEMDVVPIPEMVAVPVPIEEDTKTASADTEPPTVRNTGTEPTVVLPKKDGEPVAPAPTSRKPSMQAWIIGALFGVGALGCVAVGMWLLMWEPDPPSAVIEIRYYKPVFETMPSVAVRAGQTTRVNFRIDRQGVDFPLKIEFDRFPAGVSLEQDPLTVPAGASEVVAAFQASDIAQDSNTKVKVSLWDGGDKLDEKTLDISVQSQPLPEFLEFDPDRTVKIGAKYTLPFRIDRKGRRDPLLVRIHPEELPEFITQEPVPSMPDEERLYLRLTVKPGVPLPEYILPVQILMNGIVLPGKTKNITLTLER